MITRIWEGKKECVDRPYYCGQILIEAGKYEGMWETVTNGVDTEEEARHQLQEFLKFSETQAQK